MVFCHSVHRVGYNVPQHGAKDKVQSNKTAIMRKNIPLSLLGVARRGKKFFFFFLASTGSSQKNKNALAQMVKNVESIKVRSKKKSK